MRYPELARFMRNILEGREISVNQLTMTCGYIPKNRHYDVIEGRRCYQAWEVALVEKALGISIPWRYLRGEDRFGRQVKDLQLRLQIQEKP